MAIKRSSGTARTGMMRKGHMPMPQGKMSGAHGITNGGGKHKTLRNADNAVGSRVPTMQKRFENPAQSITGNKSKLYNK